MYLVFTSDNGVDRLPVPRRLLNDSHFLIVISSSTKGQNYLDPEIPLNHVCSSEECVEILQAIEANRQVKPDCFVACARFCQELSIDCALLTQLVPLHQVSCRNMPYLCPVLFTLWRSDYRELVTDICERCLGKKLTKTQTKNYQAFKTNIRNLCAWKIRHSRELYNRIVGIRDKMAK